MKKYIVISFLAFLLVIPFINAQDITIVDPNFEQALIDLEIDSDAAINGFAVVEDISTVISLNVSSYEISDLTGIAGFTALETLNCSNNSLTILGLSSNLALKDLNCSNNKLIGLDVSANTSLIDLNFTNNLITGEYNSQNEALTNLNCSNNRLTSLTVNNHSSLQTLNFSGNNISSFDALNNLALQFLLTGSNQLTQIVIVDYPDLKILDCSNNQLSDLDLINDAGEAFNPLLTNLSCSANRLTSLDVSKNEELTLLNLSDNLISGTLDVTYNPLLESLFCASNGITNLDLTLSTLLSSLDASNNEILALDLSNINNPNCSNPEDPQGEEIPCSSTINVSNNQLTSLNINNYNNEYISSFDARDNDDLVCIQVEDVDEANDASGWQNGSAYYSADGNCIDNLTYVPDDNFEAYLESEGLGDGTENNNFVSKATVSLYSSLDVSFDNLDLNGLEKIKDLTGIEDFVALETLDCSNNLLKKLDLSSNTALNSLDCSNNALPFLDLNANVVLEILYCSNNQFVDANNSDNNYVLNRLELSDVAPLMILDCSMNEIHSLDVKNYGSTLSTLNCSENQIKVLDLSLNTALTSLMVQDNVLSFLNLKNGANTALVTFNALGNTDLFCIQVDDVAYAEDTMNGWSEGPNVAVYSTECGTYVPDSAFEQALIDQSIDTDGTLDNFVATSDINTLTSLNISGKLIIDLTGIEAFVALEELICSDNDLTQLDLSANTALTTLDCSENLIKNLDVSFLTLTTLNATINPNLYCINVLDVDLANMNTNWQKDNDIASYSTNCDGGRFIEIPDDNFYQALVELEFDADDADPLTVNTVLTSKIEHLEILDVNNRSIDSLIGIREFKLLKDLDCSANYLNKLDLSEMTHLEKLNCGSNYFLTTDTANTLGLLNISGTDSLIELFCGSNNLTHLDVSSIGTLEELDCSNNNLDAINSNTILKKLNISNNYFGTIDISTITTIEELNCNSNQITSLIGTVNNTNLKILSIDDNNLTGSGIDVSNYTVLTNLSMRSNLFTGTLDLTANNNLITLDFSDNTIDNIMLDSAASLTSLQGSQNELNSLTLTNYNDLKTLNIAYNTIDELILNSNTALKYFNASNNVLPSLDLSNQTELVELNVSSNMMSELTLPLDIGNLRTINCSDNLLEVIILDTIGTNGCPADPELNSLGFPDYCPENISINVSNNQLEFLSVKMVDYPEITNFNAMTNPNLNCIEIDDNNLVPDGPDDWQKDDLAEYNENCHFGETYIPDDGFEQALIDLGYDSFNAGTADGLDNYVSTDNIDSITILEIFNEGIQDLTGLEDFEDLATFNFSGNTLDPMIYQLDLSSNTSLEVLTCSNTGISELDLSLNTALINVNCSGNNLSVEGLSFNESLEILNISDNDFALFYSEDLPNVTELIINNNPIVDLDLSSNTMLTKLHCASNSMLQTLIIKNGNNTSLVDFDAQLNPNLTCIEVDDVVYSTDNWTNIDDQTSFSVDCHYYQTNIPDINFERALIALGYDDDAFGDEDNYVPTANIETISFLNISDEGILDLTGLEDFEALINLNCSMNELESIDLSANTALTTLDCSNNQIENLNITSNSALTTLNASFNELTDIPLDSNTDLLNLDLSNNFLVAIDINALSLLEILDVSFNQLNSLNATSNSNLKELYCQNNLLINDQLNIRNDNNENLEQLNAQDNPDLSCILVDDPNAVILNEDGLYDFWFKDNTANYQEICLDADNDGVANTEDLCPNTPFGVDVDLFGCPYLVLPYDNFNVLITGETCISSNNGKINITAIEILNYTATIIGNGYSNVYDFTNEVEIRNLLAGSYVLCITIENEPDIIFCYDIVITQPEELAVASRISQTNKTISVDLSGSINYTIEINGLTFNTSESEIVLGLKNGLNTLKINTDLDCQGVYKENILLSKDLISYPNPFKDQVNIHLGNNETEMVDIVIYSNIGQAVMTKSILAKKGSITIDGSILPKGIYFVSLKSKSLFNTIKIVKK